MFCSQLETNLKRAAKARRNIGEDGLREIKKFWAENIHRLIWVDDVEKAVWSSEEMERPTTNQTIVRAMKGRLKAS